jgi:hypothetical protein
MQRTLASAALALTILPQAASAAGPFDGVWSVKQDCGNTPDGARGYKYAFDAIVKDGNLEGQYGTRGTPASETLTGKIEADGSGTLMAMGLTNVPETTIGFVKPGTHFAFPVTVHFEATKGTGIRTIGRPCQFSFTRK